MPEEDDKQLIQPGIIALPPLRMALVHANDERLKKALQAALGKVAVDPATQEEQVKSKSLIKIIEHLEKKL
jgi:hypothetical protein